MEKTQFKRESLIVTRHAGLARYFVEKGWVPPDTPVLCQAGPQDVRGKNVFGILPLSVASHAETVTSIPLRIPMELRGKELTAEEFDSCVVGPPTTYVISKISGPR